ncbi:MAG: hypothetical protein SFU98_21030 [Leptospiraceae bacterium]|nr:hypothetical protein [Leptospiraceae bacterium]
MHKFYLLYLAFGIIISCAGEFRSKRLIFSTANSAFYKLERDETPDKELLKNTFGHPYKISAEKLIGILGEIKFTKSTRINQIRDYVFHAKELDSLCPDLVQVFENIDRKHLAVVISQYDHTQSVISNKKRTSFYIWIDDAGMNLVFGDIQNEVSREDSINFYDWTRIQPIQLTIKADQNEIQESSSYSFKKVKGFFNRKWLIFSLADLSKYSPRSETKEVQESKE